jgi:hypothetical protein
LGEGVSPGHRELWLGGLGVLQLSAFGLATELDEQLVRFQIFFSVASVLLFSLGILLSTVFQIFSANASRSRARNRQLPARKAIRDAPQHKTPTMKQSRQREVGLTIEKC